MKELYLHSFCCELPALNNTLWRRHSDCNCLQVLYSSCLTDQCALQILVHHECALQMLVQDVDAGSCVLVPTKSTAVKTYNVCVHEFMCI